MSNMPKNPNSVPKGEDEETPESLATLVSHILENSSLYAANQLVKSKNPVKKFIWALVLVFGIGGCAFEVQRFLKLYLEYDVVTSVQVERPWKVTFPAVTICDLRHMKGFIYDHIDHIGKCKDGNSYHERKKMCVNLLNFFKTENRSMENTTSPNTDNPHYESSCYETIRNLLDGRKGEPFRRFQNLYSRLNIDRRIQLSRKTEELIQSCTFNGEKCSSKDQRMFQSLHHGKCFTFNGNTTEPLTTQYVGRTSGLDIRLFRDPEKYDMRSEDVGFRIAVHDPDSQANSEDQEIIITPGLQTYIAVQKTSTHRLQHPYKDRCVNYSDGKYSSMGSEEKCILQCLKDMSKSECNCIDPTLLAESGVKHCDLTKPFEVCCLSKVVDSIIEEGFNCDCPPSCRSVNYHVTVSSAQWPSREQAYQADNVNRRYKRSKVNDEEPKKDEEEDSTDKGRDEYNGNEEESQVGRGNTDSTETSAEEESEYYEDEEDDQTKDEEDDQTKDEEDDQTKDEGTTMPDVEYEYNEDEEDGQVKANGVTVPDEDAKSSESEEKEKGKDTAYETVDDLRIKPHTFGSANIFNRLREAFGLSQGKEIHECMEFHKKAESCLCACKDDRTKIMEKVRASSAKVKIYYQNLEHQIFQQKAALEETELFSQLGGQLGLWVGISIFAAFESINCLILLGSFFMKRCIFRKKSSISPAHQSSETLDSVRNAKCVPLQNYKVKPSH